MIEFTLGEPIPEGAPTLRRLAVRAVVWRGETLLMVRTNKGTTSSRAEGRRRARMTRRRSCVRRWRRQAIWCVRWVRCFAVPLSGEGICTTKVSTFT